MTRTKSAAKEIKVEQEREYKTGVKYGYETDGTSYWLAPALVEAWGKIYDQERALDTIIDTVVRSVAQMRRYVESERRQWWEMVYSELGLDRSKSYSFSRLEGRLTPTEAPKEEKKE